MPSLIKPREPLERQSARERFAFAIISTFSNDAIELSSPACVLPEMKVAVFALGLLPLVCGAAEPPLFPSAEGTTWNYDLVQEKPIESFDLTEPKEEEHLAVTYRLGGIETIDTKDLQRLEIYHDHTLESVNLVAIEKRGIICQAR